MDRSMFFKILATRERRKMSLEPSWGQTKIYTVQSPGLTPYIGYTTQGLRERMKDHQHAYAKAREDGCSDHMATGMAEIFLVEEYPCSSRDEAKARVQAYRNKFN